MTQPALDPRAQREAYYTRIASQHLAPLWESMAALVPEQPKTPCLPHLWRYDEIRPWLLESGQLISAKEAVRRVLILENPGMPGSAAVTQSLYAGLQLILPGEVAPSHRHTQSALRLVIEGSGAYTSVEGERATMHAGDFIITPSWTWHDHGNAGAGPVVWLDGLDIPLVRFFDCGFAESYPDEVQPVSRAEGDALARYGANLLPVDYEPTSLASPVFAYPYARTRDALARLGRDSEPDGAHGHKMQFVNPASGASAMPTIAAFAQLLPKGFDGQAQRTTDGAVYQVIEGRGSVAIGHTRLSFAARDIFVVPSWHWCTLQAETETVLFSFSDRPVQRAVGLWRQQRLPV